VLWKCKANVGVAVEQLQGVVEGWFTQITTKMHADTFEVFFPLSFSFDGLSL